MREGRAEALGGRGGVKPCEGSIGVKASGGRGGVRRWPCACRPHRRQRCRRHALHDAAVTQPACLCHARRSVMVRAEQLGGCCVVCRP